MWVCGWEDGNKGDGKVRETAWEDQERWRMEKDRAGDMIMRGEEEGLAGEAAAQDAAASTMACG